MNADHGGGASSSSFGHAVAGENDFITMDDFVQDMSDGGGDDDGILVRRPWRTLRTRSSLRNSLINRLDNDDLLFGSPRWLENFKEMKQEAKDPESAINVGA